MRRPPISQKVIEGIISACSFLLAGDVEATFQSSIDPEAEEAQVIAADEWARKMRQWMRERGVWKDEGR
jgi:hypothetical protein